jgi:hypothetical protein
MVDLPVELDCFGQGLKERTCPRIWDLDAGLTGWKSERLFDRVHWYYQTCFLQPVDRVPCWV